MRCEADAGVVGTFARVWLVRMKNPKSGEEKKVFALKVLRKAEGERLFLERIADAPF